MAFFLTEGQQSILQDLVDGGTGRGLYADTSKPKANAYNYLFNLLGGNAGPTEGAEAAVWNWLKGAENVNRGLGPFSAFIRRYTVAQFRLRYGETLNESAVQGASDIIAESVVDSIVENGGRVPTINEIGTFDAASIGSQLSAFVPSGAQADIALWSGNPLFIPLGDASFFFDNILGSSKGTYDFIAMVAAAFDALPRATQAGTLGDLFQQIYDLLEIEFLDSGSAIAAAVLAADQFWASAYGELPLTVGNVIQNLNSNNISLATGDVFIGEQDKAQRFFVRQGGPIVHTGGENDEILLLGSAVLVDGGAGVDSISFGLSRQDPLELEFRELSQASVQSYSGHISGIGAGDFLGLTDEEFGTLFNIEQIKLSRFDDRLNVESFQSVGSGLSVDAGRGKDTADFSDLEGLVRLIFRADSEIVVSFADKLVTISDFEDIKLGDYADLLEIDDSVDLSQFTDVIIDLGGSSQSQGLADGISAENRTTDVVIDLSLPVQRISGGDGLLQFIGAEAADGGSGDDTILATDEGDVIKGGAGKDNLIGGARRDIIVGGADETVDDGDADTLTGGGGADKFYAGDGDTITDPGNGDTIFLNGMRLTGGEETEEGSRVYEDGMGGTYTTVGGTLTFSINPSITIENFRNGLAGIRLIDAEPDDDDDTDDGRPDFDDPERNRDPLVIDLDGDRNVVTTLNQSVAFFDLDNDGFAENVAWARASDGFLVRDLDGNGLIESGAELFGTGNVDSQSGGFREFGEDGFIELAVLDSNGDGAITAADAEFAQLQVWIDANLDAVTDEGELVSLEELGIVSISLTTFGADHVVIAGDNSLVDRASTVAFQDGSTTSIYDAYFSIDQYNAFERLDDFEIDASLADLPFLLGTGAVSDLDVAMTRDPGLAELVRELAELDASSAHRLLDLTQQIVLRWTGADQIASDTRGASINAQWLTALEKVLGDDFSQANIGRNPRADAARLLNDQWTSFIGRTAAKLVGQTALAGTITPGLTYEAAAFFTAAEGASLATALAGAAANQPASASEAISYWSGVINVLRAYQPTLGLSDAVFYGEMNQALNGAGIALDADELRNAFVVSSSQDEAGNLFRADTGNGDLILINADAGVVDGVTGGDTYIVGAQVSSLDIVASGSRNELFLPDFELADLTYEVVLEEGRTWIRIFEDGGEFNIRVRAEIDENGLSADVSKIRFATGDAVDLIGFLPLSGAASGIVLGNESPEVITGTSEDDLIIGLGQNSTYAFGPGSGNDTISDLNGFNDRIIIVANFADVSFEVLRDGVTDDLLITLDATGDSLRIVGHNTDSNKAIEVFEFSDTELTVQQLDFILNTGTAGDDTIIGSRRDEVIAGLGGNDTLQGGAGTDTYQIELGWGDDRIIESDSGNRVEFGVGISVADITAERGANGDLVLRSVAGDSLTIVGGLRAPVVTGFTFADGTVKPLIDFISETITDEQSVISGTAAGERLDGSDQNEIFVGNGGSDTFSGNGGADQYRIDAPFTRVFGSSLGIDTLIAPEGASVEEFRFRGNLYGFGTEGPEVAGTSIDFIQFEDGTVIDLTGDGLLVGTDGDDFLYGTNEVDTVFRPGAGDDIIIGNTSDFRDDTYEFEVGFGNDRISDFGGRNDEIVFLSSELSVDNATFEKIANDLVISFASGDTLTVENHYLNHPYGTGIPVSGDASGNIEFFRFGDGSGFRGVNGFIASQTDGDDLVMFGELSNRSRDGGLGNDILFGGREQNFYIWRVGDGNDIIKDGGGSGQQLRLFGMEPEDVEITRDPTDPYSILFTNIATGETLTIDGTPTDIDGFQPTLRGLPIQEFLFDSITLTDDDIIDAAFASNSTDGDDVIGTFNSSRTIRPGLGDDRINIDFGSETIAIEENSGAKIITFDPEQFALRPFSLDFEGLSREDLAFTEIQEVNGQIGRHLQITGGGTTVTIVNGLDRRLNQAPDQDLPTSGLRFNVSASGQSALSASGFGPNNNNPIEIQTGRNAPLLAGSAGTDVLQGTGAIDDLITPGAGADFIFGTDGNDRVALDIGFGTNRYESNGGSLTIEVGAGVAAADMQLAWSLDEPGQIELSIAGTDDRLLFAPGALAEILVDGEILSTNPPELIDPTTLPTSEVNPGQLGISQSGDELIISNGGGARIRLEAGSGNDFVQDARYEASLAGSDDLTGWGANRLQLGGVSDFSELRFIVEDTSPNDLIIEKADGSRVTILKQFGFGIPQEQSGYISPDLDGDGTPDWESIDFDGDFVADFSVLDPDGDGVPNWLATDFDGDGQSDWEEYALAEATLPDTTVTAEDSDLDGNFDLYRFGPAEISFGGPPPLTFSIRDIDGDGIGDEYSEDGVTWFAAPTDGTGVVDWSLLDINSDGQSDLAGFADGTGPSWLSNVDLQVGAVRWTVTGQGELFDQTGEFVASREYDLSTGASTYTVFAGGTSIGFGPPTRTAFLARDVDGDGIADEVAPDLDADGQPDTILDPSARTVVDVIQIEGQFGFDSPFSTIIPLENLIPLIEFVTIPPVTEIDLDALKPVASDGIETLLLETGDSIDSLAGDDTVISTGGGGEFRWSAGDGNDTFQSTQRFADNAQGTTALDTIVFEGVIDPALLRYSASETNPSDLVVENLETGEFLTIKGQLGALEGRSEATPPVGRFVFEGGLELSAGDVTQLTREPIEIDDSVQRTNDDGGLLDGGAGGDDNNQLLGGAGDDIYLFGRDYAEDIIVDAGGSDTVQFGEGITQSDLFFSRTGENGEDLLIEVLGLERLTLTIKGQFGDEANRIERFAFDDGSRLTAQNVQEFILDTISTGDDDAILGFRTGDVIRGSGGNDAITGAGGDDLIFGGSGRDSAIFTGSRDEYTISVDGDVTTVTDTVAGRDGIDTLEGIEDLIFLGDDQTTALAPENIAPVVSELAFQVEEDGTLVIDRGSLIAGGTDANGDTLSLASVANASNGQVWQSADGSVRFRPTADFAGEAGFDYSLSDGNGGASTARVVVTVNASNDAPVISLASLTFASFEDTLVDWLLPAGSITDADGDALSVTAQLASGEALPDWLSFDGERFTGTPPADFNGAIDIELIADDGIAATSAALTLDILAVNDAPSVAQQPVDVVLRPGETFSLSVPQSTFTDVEGDPITLEIVAANGGELPDWIVVNGLEISGTVPEAFDEPLEIAVVADDGRAANVTTFELVPFVNTPPEVLQNIDSVFVEEDTAINLEVPAGTFADIDGDALTLSATSLDGSELPAWLSFDGAAFTGTPPQDFNGVIDLIVSASDGEASVSTALTITVTPVNDAPVATLVLNNVSTIEDAPFAFAIDQAAFADVDGDALTLSATQADGSDLPDWIAFDGVSFTGIPPRDFNGSIELSVTASDGELSTSQSFTLTIDPLNDPPVLLQPLADQSGLEDTSISFDVPDGTFADVDGDVLTLAATLLDGSALPDWLSFDGAQFTGTPPQDFNGFLDITVTASDAEESASDSFRVTIDAVNDAPVVVTALSDVTSLEDEAISVLLPDGTFADVDGDALSIAATLADGGELPAWLSFDGMQFTGTPPQDFNGAIGLLVTASDGELTAEAAFTLTIDPANDAPVLIQALADVSSDEDASFSIEIPAGTFADVDGDALTLSATLSGGAALPAWLNFDGTTLTGTPPQDFNGAFDLTVTATDGELTASDTFTLTIDPVNDAPILVQATADLEANVGDTLSIDFANGVFADVDGDELTFSASLSDGSALPSWLTFTGGVLASDSVPAQSGDYAITVSASDGQASASDSFVLTVIGGNTTPMAQDDGVFVTTANRDLAIDPNSLFENDVDAEGDALTLVSVQDASIGEVSVDTDGNIIYIPDAVYVGEATFTYTVTDSEFTSTATVTINIDPSDEFDGFRQGNDNNNFLFGSLFGLNRIFGAGGNDKIFGGFASDELAGGDGDDKIFGLLGDDDLYGGQGDDALYGGFGFDTAHLLGDRDDYQIFTSGGFFNVTQTVDLDAAVDGDDGVDTLISIEQLEFKDGVTLSIASPIILDLAGDGVQTVSADESNALFDLDGDGLADDTSWIGANDAFLFLDRDGNGTVSGVQEISFIDDVEDAASDLEGLRAFDSNSDGVLNSEDERFDEFGVWNDGDGDGAVDEGETATLSEVGIASVNLDGTPVEAITQFGEVAIANTGSYTLTNGATRDFADAALTFFSAATNLPELNTTTYDLDRKAKKYRIHISGGVAAVDRKRRRSSVNSLAGQLGANTIISTKTGDYGRFAPVVLDLDGDGIEMVRMKRSNARFDYAGDGRSDQTGWLSGDDGFLVIDRNNDGFITEASELSLASEDESTQTGLQGLANLDSNGDGVVDVDDARFGELRVWRDRNGNGRTDTGELMMLEEAGIVSISLAATGLDDRVKLDRNAITATTTFARSNGTTSTAAAVSLAYRPAEGRRARSSAFDLSSVGFSGLEFSSDLFLRSASGPQLREQSPSIDDVFASLRGDLGGTNSDLFDRFTQPQRNIDVALEPGQSILFGTVGAPSTQVLPHERLILDPLGSELGVQSHTRFNDSVIEQRWAADHPSITQEGIGSIPEQAVAIASDSNGPANTDAELARRLMMIRQEMNAFGVNQAAETDRLQTDTPDHMYFYA